LAPGAKKGNGPPPLVKKGAGPPPLVKKKTRKIEDSSDEEDNGKDAGSSRKKN
jgi:hypothetical protein